MTANTYFPFFLKFTHIFKHTVTCSDVFLSESALQCICNPFCLHEQNLKPAHRLAYGVLAPQARRQAVMRHPCTVACVRDSGTRQPHLALFFVCLEPF